MTLQELYIRVLALCVTQQATCDEIVTLKQETDFLIQSTKDPELSEVLLELYDALEEALEGMVMIDATLLETLQ